MVAGELLVRLRSDFPACAHCLLAKGAGLKSVTGTYILDQVRLRHGITAMEPVFGGVHAVDRRRAAQLRFGMKAPGGGAAAGPAAGTTVPDLSQIYLVRVHPKTDLLALAAEFRRDSNVVSAEPNYLYKAQSIVGSRQLIARPLSPLPPEEGQDEGMAEETSPLPNDPFLNSSGSWGQDFPDLWGLFQIHVPEAWELSQGEGVIVAVIDTGIDIEHPDLKANVWHNAGEIPGNGIDDDGNGFIDDVNGWDFTQCVQLDSSGFCVQPKAPGADVSDPIGHGTHVAGTIAAVGDNGIGIIGVAPQAQVMAVKAIDRSGQGTNADFAAAIVYAAENGAQVINVSWAGPQSDTITMAIDYVTQTFDVVVVAAAGNGGVPLEQGVYPANLPEVIAVGATTHTDERASFSNFGGPLDLVAPGGGDSVPTSAAEPGRSILSLWAKDSDLGTSCQEECHCRDPVCCADPECDDEVCQTVCSPAAWVVDNQYVRLGGTSQAAPHVSAVAALVRSRHPEFTRQQVRQVLVSTADDLGPAGWDLNFGYGRVNAQQAVAIDSIPVAEIVVPENRGKIWERVFPFTVSGNVLAPGGSVHAWRLTLRREDNNNPVEIARGTQPVTSGALATLTLGGAQGLELGQRYVLQLEVGDCNGNTATDTKAFLVPNPQFASIPVPDPFDEGGAGVITANGTLLAVTRLDRDPPHDTSVWLFNTDTRQLERIRSAGSGRLSPDGRFLLYSGFQSGWHLLDLITGSLRTVPLASVASRSPPPVVLAMEATRIGFISQANLDPAVGNADGSAEVFLLDLPDGPVRQVTSGPPASFGTEADDLVMTPDGQRLAFTSSTNLDPTASAGGIRQVFVYDDDATVVRQLTGPSRSGTDGVRPAISADGNTVAYEANGIFLTSVKSGDTQQIVDSGGSPAVPLLSADATKLAFVASADLDSQMLNEDLSPEIFLLDLTTRHILQVTDTVNFSFVPYDSRMDASGSSLLVTTSGELAGLALQPPAVRVLRRRRTNRPPNLDAPLVIDAQEGKPSRTELRATDPDGDPITFYVQRVPPFVYGPDPMRLRDLAHSVLTDHGDGTAELSFMPEDTDAGTYPLRIAAFDEAGGVDVRDVTLVIQDTQPEGDANCDGSLGLDDVQAMISALFNPGARAQCITTDANVDGQVTVSDLVALLTKLGP